MDDEIEIDLTKLINIVRRHAWLLILGLVLGLASGACYSVWQTPIYEASTSMLVLRAPQQTASDMTYLTDQQMVQTYIKMATTGPVLSAASQQLGYTVDPEKIQVRQLENSQIIQITVEDTNPQRATETANALVQVLIEEYKGLQTSRYAEREQSLQTQINQMERQIADLQAQISNGNSGPDNAPTQLQTTLDLYQTIYANLLNSLEQMRLAQLQGTSNAVQIDPAVVPENPVRPKPLLYTLIAGGIGLLLAVGTAFLMEQLDKTLKTPEDVEHLLGLPILGLIAEIPYLKKDVQAIYVLQNPRSPVTEAFRSLRTNLEFSAVDKPLKIIQVTSASTDEGKSTVAANLAAVLSQAGKRVVLVDTDMRRPQIHRFFGLSNRVGLSDLFHNHASLADVSHRVGDLPGLEVVTSGSLPPNPTELLASETMNKILNELKQQVDIVVLDSPPSLVADAQALAAKADGLLLVVQPGYTRADAAAVTLKLMQRTGARVLGVVLNRIPRNHAYYYGSYGHYNPYQGHYDAYSDDGGRATKRSKQRACEQPKISVSSPILAQSHESDSEQVPQPPANH